MSGIGGVAAGVAGPGGLGVESKEIGFGGVMPSLGGDGLRGDLRGGFGCNCCDSVSVVLLSGCVNSRSLAIVPTFNDDVELARWCKAGAEGIRCGEATVIGPPKGAPKDGSGSEDS